MYHQFEHRRQSSSLRYWIFLCLLWVALFVFAFIPSKLSAHGGGLDRYGCHHDRKRGGYHCHRSDWYGSTRSPAQQNRPLADSPTHSPTRQLPASLMRYSQADVDLMLAQQKEKLIEAAVVEFEKRLSPLAAQAEADKATILALEKQNQSLQSQIEAMQRYIEHLRSTK